MIVLLLLVLTVSSTYGSSCKNKLDVVAVLDGSGSISSSDFIKLKNATIQLAQDLNLGSNEQQFGALVFSSSVTNIIPLSTDVQSLRNNISSITKPGGGTATHLGIRSMQQMFRSYGRTGTKKVGIVITDGRSNSESDTISAARAAKNAGITMISVGVGSARNLNMNELRAIASSSSNVMLLQNFDALKTKIKSLIQKICTVDGQWSSWSTPSRGSCSRSCGRGSRTVTKTRSCSNPIPSGGGKPCNGSSRQIYSEICNSNKCPVDGGWTVWKELSRSPCSVTCGRGVVTVRQSRTCTKPKPENGGKQCNGSGTKVYTESCNKGACQGISCDGCHYANGVGFLPHPTDCRFFVQCIRWGASYQIKQCPSGLQWNQEDLTCAFPSTVNCTTTATAVPPVQTLPSKAPTEDVCLMKAVPGKPSSYFEKVPGHGLVKRKCAAGTIFNITVCSCVHGGSTPETDCQEEVYLPLTTDLNDHSEHKLYVANNGVKITRGQASFANNAVLRIPRFSNMDFGKTLDISFMLHKGATTSKNMAVVTNAACNHTGSIYIIQQPSDIEFRVQNRKGVVSTLSVPLSKATSKVRLTIQKSIMTGNVNGISKTTPFKGRIGKVHCGLQIGRGTGYDNFEGRLENFKLSLCKS